MKSCWSFLLFLFIILLEHMIILSLKKGTYSQWIAYVSAHGKRGETWWGVRCDTYTRMIAIELPIFGSNVTVVLHACAMYHCIRLLTCDRRRRGYAPPV